MIIEQIAIAFFLFTVNSLFLESSRGFGVLWTTTIAALLAPSQGHLQSRGTGLLRALESNY
jgi:hypothetical protein